MIESILKYNISKKELTYLILPLFLLLILFPTVIAPNNTFITRSSDVLLIINSELSVVKNPLSLWNNQWLTGLPAYADPLSDRFYPFFYPIFVLTQDAFIINLILFIHLYIAYLCFFKLSKLMTDNLDIRMIASLFYIFSGVILARVYVGHVLLLFVLTWIPLLYYAFFKIIWDNEVTIKNISIFILSLVLIFFTGSLYYFFYSCLILSVFFIYYLFKQKISKGQILAISGAFTIGALIFAIKCIPIIFISNSLDRIDPVNPIGDGGYLESVLASIVFGTPIDKVFAFWESAVLIGIIPLLLIILALIFDREERAIPAFFAIIFAFIWAAGGNTILLFIHLMPVLSNFRCAGRILGALLPILLLFAICGVEILKTRIKNKEDFTLNPIQKRNVILGSVILLFIKFLELPFQTNISLESYIAVILIIGFICLLYFNRATLNNIVAYLIIAGLVNGIIVIRNVYDTPLTIKNEAIIILAIIITLIAFFSRNYLHLSNFKSNHIIYSSILIIGLGIILIGNTSYLQNTDPELNMSSSLPIIEKITADNINNGQIWVLETGWSFQHLDFTYWFIKNEIHPVRAYYGYFMKTTIAPIFNIGNTSYYTSNYIIDTLYLENGQQNIPEVTFKVNNISVYKPSDVLPNAFVIRNNQLIPSAIEKFSTDEIIISGQFLNGDVAILKTAFYPGWRINGMDTINSGNMPSAKLQSPTTSIIFKYDPIDVKIAGILSGLGVILFIITIVKRHEIEKYLNTINKIDIPITKNRKRKR